MNPRREILRIARDLLSSREVVFQVNKIRRHPRYGPTVEFSIYTLYKGSLEDVERMAPRAVLDTKSDVKALKDMLHPSLITYTVAIKGKDDDRFLVSGISVFSAQSSREVPFRGSRDLQEMLTPVLGRMKSQTIAPFFIFDGDHVIESGRA